MLSAQGKVVEIPHSYVRVVGRWYDFGAICVLKDDFSDLWSLMGDMSFEIENHYNIDGMNTENNCWGTNCIVASIWEYGLSDLIRIVELIIVSI